jgi:hypothetical protein
MCLLILPLWPKYRVSGSAAANPSVPNAAFLPVTLVTATRQLAKARRSVPIGKP